MRWLHAGQLAKRDQRWVDTGAVGRETKVQAMAYDATVVDVMIASPSDVTTERRVIREVLDEWNIVNARERKLVVLPVSWESHAAPLMGDRPQAIINRQVLEHADLLIAVFWTRLGSPTGKADSGTVEEIEEHIAAGKPAMIYFSDQPVHPSSVDAAQYEALLKFRKSCEERGLRNRDIPQRPVVRNG
jgi:hypothetical protein